jgi:hypothetical protein
LLLLLFAFSIRQYNRIYLVAFLIPDCIGLFRFSISIIAPHPFFAAEMSICSAAAQDEEVGNATRIMTENKNKRRTCRDEDELQTILDAFCEADFGE